ncbi:protein Wnt-7b-like [Centruroides vittatus]|uniref:protein Wnt-7b-like n=1 Tax=Centruroides vittatus TaxID=120091 RepID=UPI003510C216
MSSRWTIVTLLLCIFYTSVNLRSLSSVVAFSANVICNNIPGLTTTQRRLCYRRPDVIVAVGEGSRMAIMECQKQFRNHRWNCTAIGSDAVFGHVVTVGSKEAAYVYAINSAGVAYAVTQACGRGNISRCGCDKTKDGVYKSWKWGGCSADVKYGMEIARKFLDVRELEKDARSLMNLQNNKAGRRAVKDTTLTECKCHGVSGSCTMKTCWKMLPPFTRIGEYLLNRYHKAKRVMARPSKKFLPLILRLKKHKGTFKRPKPKDLVYLEKSPNYCEKDLSVGSLGTVGRLCNRTSSDMDGCGLLCCGRGYNTHQYNKTWQCKCKFHWCCFVDCQVCSERTEEYTCK